MSELWTGHWAEANVGAVIRGASADDRKRLEELIGVALRRNPKRAQLLVSTVLGKHIPADPRTIRAAGADLGQRVGEVLRGESALVVGFAETATLLGQLVADELEAPYIHSTRRTDHAAINWAKFIENHSHAPSHVLQPWPATLMEQGNVVVLVDDELSTGRTALGTIRAIHARTPRNRYIIAALVDMTTETHQAELAEAARSLGVEITCVALASGTIEMPTKVTLPNDVNATPATSGSTGKVIRIKAPWTAEARECGRHGMTADRDAFDSAISATARMVTALLPQPHGRTRVLGTEELMHAPLRIALELPGTVTFSTTTRSPAVVVDAPGYPLRSAISFPAHEAGSEGTRYAYNLVQGDHDQIVLVIDEDYDTPSISELLKTLASLADVVLVVTVRTYRPPKPVRSPEFGSYPRDDVAWLLTDLSDLPLEAPADERERAMQGTGHYAETLPIEYQPSIAYMELFRAALEASAQRVAESVASVGQQIRRLRGPGAVLVSLARAGTPVGVLIRRWAREVHDMDWPHYSISIIRGRGIDQTALRYIATRHNPRDAIFVDGWTGKGAIARELKLAVAQANAELKTAFDDRLAVLADPGHCTSLFGSRDDFLIPSACLNSTVSGLVSRTVLNDRYLRPDQFHGAKFYRNLVSSDVSNEFVETIASHFDDLKMMGDLPNSSTPPDWRGWRTVEALAAEYGITNLNLIKPGVGETTRVLLRRQPWKILARPDRAEDLAHVYLLAEERTVEVEERPNLGFSCVGVIQPVGRDVDQ